MLSDKTTCTKGGDVALPDAFHDRQDQYHMVFLAEPAAVRDALRKAVARYTRRISADCAGTLELALAEALNNVVEHSYSALPPGPIDLTLILRTAAMECRIADTGHPMPDLSLPEGRMQNVAQQVDELAEGGWGWALIRTLTTDLTYVRSDGCNRLSFCVPLSDI
ncbi:MAG: ATP-binding protein [Albidovulum sp.]